MTGGRNDVEIEIFDRRVRIDGHYLEPLHQSDRRRGKIARGKRNA